MNKKFDFINNPKEFKEKIENDNHELKKRIIKFLDTTHGKEFLYEAIEKDENLRNYLRNLYVEKNFIDGDIGLIGATGAIGEPGIVGNSGISGYSYGMGGITGIQGVTGMID